MVTVEDMRSAILQYCDTRAGCGDCCIRDLKYDNSCTSDNKEGYEKRIEERFIRVVHDKIEECCKKCNCECNRCCLDKLHLNCNDSNTDVETLMKCYNTIIEYEKQNSEVTNEEPDIKLVSSDNNDSITVVDENDDILPVDDEICIIKFTQTQIKHLIEWFDSGFIRKIIEDDNIENMNYLCDMCEIYKKLKEKDV